MDGEGQANWEGRLDSMLKQIALFWMMIHLAITPSVLDKKLTSNVNSLVQFFIEHSRMFHNMTAEEEMGEEELE